MRHSKELQTILDEKNEDPFSLLDRLEKKRVCFENMSPMLRTLLSYQSNKQNENYKPDNYIAIN